MRKSKIYNFLQPLIPVFAWVIILWGKPEFSIANYVAKVYKLSANEVRPLDIVLFTAASTYFLRFIDWLIAKIYASIQAIKSLSLGVIFTNLQNTKETFTTIDIPQGSPKRVKVTVNVQFYNQFLFSTLISRYFSSIILQIDWLSTWLQVEIDGINNIQNYVAFEQGIMNIDLLKLAHWPKGSIEIVLAIVSIHTNTTSGFLNTSIKVEGSKFKKWLLKRTLKFTQTNHELVLQS